MDCFLKRFIQDEDAAVAFETVIVFPLLVWAWVGTFTFFDAYRVYNTSIKATYTVADLISRQEETVYGSDIDGFGEMLSAMIRDHDGVQMRATEIQRRNDGTYTVIWSHPTGTLAQLFDASLPAYEDRLPNIALGERVVIVESFIDYDPAFNLGINDLEFENYTITRPRYAGQIPYDDGTAPADPDHDDNAT